MRTRQITLCVSITLLLAATATAKIVFNKNENVNLFTTASIYVMDDDGGNIKRITDNTNSDRKPRWSPNGRQIAFGRDTTPDDGHVDLHLYLMNTDGTNARLISRYIGYIFDVAFSPDGSKLFFNLVSGIRREDLNALDPDNRHPHMLDITHVYHLDLSPDGKQIVYVNDDHDVVEKNLWFIDVDGCEPTVWTKPDPERGRMHRLNPRWSPDGKKILYTGTDFLLIEHELEDGGRQVTRLSAGTFRYIIHDIDNDTTQLLNIPDNLRPVSVDWMDGQKAVLFSAYDFNEIGKNPGPIVRKIYRYDIASEEMTFLAEGYNADWHGGELSVSPVGKQTVRWAQIKKGYTD